MQTATDQCRNGGGDYSNGSKTGPPSVCFANVHLAVALGTVELNEPLSSSRLVQQRVDMRQQFDKELRDGVKASNLKVVTNPRPDIPSGSWAKTAEAPRPFRVNSQAIRGREERFVARGARPARSSLRA